jgi:hypothetical protein
LSVTAERARSHADTSCTEEVSPSEFPISICSEFTCPGVPGEIIPGFRSRREESRLSRILHSPNKKIKGVKSKTILFNRQVDGQRVEVKAVILASAAYGLPITSDQDKYLAFQKIVSEIRRAHGKVRNPVGFSSAYILRILGLDTDAARTMRTSSSGVSG